MIKNYLRVAFRTFSKNKSYIVINALGLGISLACCIAAYLLLAFNIEFDNFHDDQKVARIFRFHALSTDKEGKLNRDSQAPIILPPMAANDIAGIERYTRYVFGNGSLRYGDQSFNENLAFADSAFFQLFDYPLESGNHRSFKDKNSIFLSQELAKKYFGNEDPTGKLMVLNSVNESQIDLIVGGVLKKVPINNTFSFQAMLRIENFIDINKIKVDDWSDWRNPSTFMELTTPENAEQVSKQLAKYIPARNKARTDVVIDSYLLGTFQIHL